jgi:energy-coupling factor transporter ATP-binding protein EcfA2
MPMYIDTVRLQEVKCFEDITLRFQSASQTGDRQSNWNVILGNNGDGKTTLLQAIAGCLMDATTAERMIKPQSLVRHRQPFARLSATLVQQDDDLLRSPSVKLRRTTRFLWRANREVQYLIVNGGQEIQGDKKMPPQFFATATILEPTEAYRALFGEHFEVLREDIDFLKRNAFLRQSERGWVSCGYGTFRRISGFTSQMALVDDPLQKRFITLFEEGAALYDCESWLKELDRQASKSKKESKHRKLLSEVKEIIIELLPEVDDLKIEEEVSFLWQGASQSHANGNSHKPTQGSSVISAVNA